MVKPENRRNGNKELLSFDLKIVCNESVLFCGGFELSKKPSVFIPASPISKPYIKKEVAMVIKPNPEGSRTRARYTLVQNATTLTPISSVNKKNRFFANMLTLLGIMSYNLPLFSNIDASFG
jgi:hypothetical protein